MSSSLAQVSEGSPAQSAGLKVGDKVLQFGSVTRANNDKDALVRSRCLSLVFVQVVYSCVRLVTSSLWSITTTGPRGVELYWPAAGHHGVPQRRGRRATHSHTATMERTRAARVGSVCFFCS